MRRAGREVLVREVGTHWTVWRRDQSTTDSCWVQLQIIHAKTTNSQQLTDVTEAAEHVSCVYYSKLTRQTIRPFKCFPFLPCNLRLFTRELITSVGIVELTKRNCGGQISKCLKLCPGLKFKTDFHSKMSACRHELGIQPQPPGNSNPAYYHHSVPAWLPSQLMQAMRAPDISQALFRNKRFIYLTSSVMCRLRAVPQR